MIGQSGHCNGHQAADGQPYRHRPALFLSSHQLSSTSLCPTEEEMGQKLPPRPAWACWEGSEASPPQPHDLRAFWWAHPGTIAPCIQSMGEECIYWISFSFPFSHIFTLFCFGLLYCHFNALTLKHLVQCRAFLKDDKQEQGCVCTFFSSGCLQAHTVVPCFSPL